MNRARMIAGVALCLFSQVLLQGQETGLLRLDKKQRAPQNDIVLWGGMEDGRFRPANEARFQWSAGTEAKLVRHGANTSWFGTISLEQKTGTYNRASLFLDPDYFPMDLVDLSNGKGSRQTGRLETGVLGDISDIWQAGVRASFQVANESKRMELRHSSLGMDVQLEPVVTFVSDDDACVVTSYLVRLRTEKVKVGPPVEADASGKVFFDKGLSYGAYEPDLGLFPVQEFSHGANAAYHSPEMSFGAGILWKRGRAGGQDYSRFRFPGSKINASFETIREGFEVDRSYHVSYQRMRDQLREILASGEGYGTDSDRVGRELNFQFRLVPHAGVLKSIGLDLDGNYWSERAVAGSLWDRTQRMGGSGALVAALSMGAFDLDLNMMAGGGGWIDRGSDPEAAAGEQPLRLTENWLRKTEYYLAPRIGMGGNLTYHIPAVKGLSLQLYGYWIRAFNISYLGGKNREIVTLKIGYSY